MPERQRGRDPNKKSRIPEWAGRERANDMAWIAENVHVLWPAAQEQLPVAGAGAIFVDTTQQPDPDAGNPFAYGATEFVEQFGDSDVKRMVASYDPTQELVIVLLKSQGRMSSYRVRFIPPPEENQQPPKS